MTEQFIIFFLQSQILIISLMSVKYTILQYGILPMESYQSILWKKSRVSFWVHFVQYQYQYQYRTLPFSFLDWKNFFYCSLVFEITKHTTFILYSYKRKYFTLLFYYQNTLKSGRLNIFLKIKYRTTITVHNFRDSCTRFKEHYIVYVPYGT